VQSLGLMTRLVSEWPQSWSYTFGLGSADLDLTLWFCFQHWVWHIYGRFCGWAEFCNNSHRHSYSWPCV